MTDRSSNKPLAFVVSLLTLMALVVPLIGTASATHGTTYCLDLVNVTNTGGESETDSNTVGETHEVRAILRTPEQVPSSTSNACEGDKKTGVGGTNIDFRIEGVNDPNPLNTTGTADYSCDIDPNTSSCSIVYTGNKPGTDQIRGWVDFDKVETTVEADDAEGVNDRTAPGEGDHCNDFEPDCTDVVQKSWTTPPPGPAAALDCDDPGGPDTERESNPTNSGSASNETYTCTVTDAQGTPVEGDHQVYGEVENGVNDPDATDGASYGSPDYGCLTDGDAACTITVTQNEGETGTAEICFWFDPDNQGAAASGAEHCANEPTGEAQNADGSDPPNDEADQVEKTWEARSASGIDAEPESDTNLPGEDHIVTVTVYDQFGQTFRGNTKIDFEFFQGSPSDTDGNTPSSPDRSCTTADSNVCSIIYTSQQTGTDLICAYRSGSQPAMSGDNNNGTCDGEAFTDADDDPAGPDTPEEDTQGRVSDDQDVVRKRWAAAGEATRLDCEPETDSNPTGSSHTITCTARNQENNLVGGANVDAEATGANDPDANTDTTSPDFSCTTDASGTCSFTHGAGGSGTTNEQGTTTYRAWIDNDNNNSTSEGDPTESRDEAVQAGSERETDNTDVVEKTWTGDARRIDCEPETATNATGTTHTVTCTVTDRTGNAVADEGVVFTETGPGEIQGSNTDTTDANGQATVTTTSNEVGEQSITGTLADDTNANEPDEEDECDRVANDPQGAPAGECSDTVTKTWVQNQQPECSDGIDNDNDGQTDFPDDDGCESANDDDERDFPNQEFGGETGQPVSEGACAGFTTGSVQSRPNSDGLIIVGTNGDDALQGSTGDDLICALDGADTVNADAGNDTVWAGGGKDAVQGGTGDDQLHGQGGRDIMVGDDGNDVLNGARSHDNLSGGGGADRLLGRAGWDTLKGNAGNDTLVGHGGNDVLQGGGGNDEARGGSGDDVFKGYIGADILRGGGGNDILRGAAGPDRLFGGPGDDILNGGAGRDRCRPGRGRDTVRNCER